MTQVLGNGRATLKKEVPFAFISGGRTIQAGPGSIEIRERTMVPILDANRNLVQTILSNPPALWP
jgi:hypothetical protein